MGKTIALYATSGCPNCAAARKDLEWRGIEFVEYDVEQDSESRTPRRVSGCCGSNSGTLSSRVGVSVCASGGNWQAYF
jgi:hypothetical protein